MLVDILEAKSPCEEERHTVDAFCCIPMFLRQQSILIRALLYLVFTGSKVIIDNSLESSTTGSA